MTSEEPALSRAKGLSLTFRPVFHQRTELNWHASFIDVSHSGGVFGGSLRLQCRWPLMRPLRLCFIDYDRQMAPVAERRGPDTEGRQIIGVSRLREIYAEHQAESP